MMKFELDDRSILLSFIAAFISLTILVISSYVAGVDQHILSVIFESSQGSLFEVMRYVTYLGDVLVVLPGAGIVMYYFYRSEERSLSIYYGSMVVSSLILSWVIKYLVRRSRPEMGLSPPTIVYSYPSGHTIGAFMLFVGFYVFYSMIYRGKHRWDLLSVCVVIPMVIGLSRMILGLHYLTDILGSILLGGAMVTLFKILVERERK